MCFAQNQQKKPPGRPSDRTARGLLCDSVLMSVTVHLTSAACYTTLHQQIFISPEIRIAISDL